MTIARFTPSVLDGAALERLFVHRHALLDDALTRVRAAATGIQRAHKLYVGPRGAGKTHLISLLHHRLIQERSAGLRIQISWLIEDPWDIETFDDLLEAILDSRTEPVPEEQHRRNAEATVIAAATAHGPIVVLAENLDRILTAIGPDGQRRLRALLENHRPMLLIATTTRLTDDLLSQAEPFYGFFDTTQLEPFTIPEAVDMLVAIAEFTGDKTLVDSLKQPAAVRRLATIAHLAGGQPRVWALLGTGLSMAGIEQMVTALLTRFDDLTPYYQEQLARLSAQEAKVVRRLAAADRPLTVRDLAQLTRIDQKSLAKTVSDLRRRGWLEKHTSVLTEKTDRRLTYYRLAEPLARLAFQVKESRGRPIRLILEFLATWYDLEELATAAAGGSSSSQTYISAAEALFSEQIVLVQSLAGSSVPAGITTPRIRRLLPESAHLEPMLCSLDDALGVLAEGHPEPLLTQPAAISSLVEQLLAEGVELIAIRLEIARLAVLSGYDWRGRLEAILSTATAEDDRFAALILLGTAHAQLADSPVTQRFVFDQLSDAATAPASPRILELAAECATYLIDRRRTDASEQLVRLARGPQQGDSVQALVDRTNLASQQGRVGDVAGAVTELERLLHEALGMLASDHPTILAIQNNLAYWRGEAGDAAGAIAEFERLVRERLRVLGPDHPHTLTTRHNLAYWRGAFDDAAEAAAEFGQLLQDELRVLGPNHPHTLTTRHNLAHLRGEAGDAAEAAAEFGQLLQDELRVLGPDHPDTLTARHSLAYWRGEAGDAAGAIAEFEQLLQDRLRVLGPDHPDTFATRHSLAYWRGIVGDTAGATAEFEQLLQDRLRVLGPDHPHTLITRHNLARLHGEGGDTAGAIAEFEQLLQDRLRVLGPDHPDTVATSRRLAYWRNAAGEGSKS